MIKLGGPRGGLVARSLLWLAVLAAACAGRPAGTPVGAAGGGDGSAGEGAGTAASGAGAGVTKDEEARMRASEERARARWFGFELAEVTTVHGGDWAAFVAAKEAREAELDAAWAEEAKQHSHHLRLDSAERVRGVRVLQEEWEAVAMADREAVIAEARRVLRLVQEGKLDELAADCVHYGGPDRVALCRKMLEERRAELAAAVRGIDPASLSARQLRFSAPEPEAGMTGQVVIPIGAPAPAPKDPRRYPSTWQLELWWSGQVMPEANGPVHARPQAPDAPPGRWRFFDLIAPYSRTPTYRI